MFNSVYAVRYRHKILAMLKVFMYVQLKVKIETIKGLLYIIETLKRLHNFLSFYEIYFVRQSFLYSLLLGIAGKLVDMVAAEFTRIARIKE